MRRIFFLLFKCGAQPVGAQRIVVGWWTTARSAGLLSNMALNALAKHRVSAGLFFVVFEGGICPISIFRFNSLSYALDILLVL